MTTLLAAIERALANVAIAPGPGAGGAGDERRATPFTSPQRRSLDEWTTEDLALLLHDRRLSARRIVTVLDELAEQPDIEVPLSAVAHAVGLTRSELRGTFSGLTFLCKQLRPGIEYDWPIIWREGVSTQPGQTSETWYHMPAGVAGRWLRTRDRHDDSPTAPPR